LFVVLGFAGLAVVLLLQNVAAALLPDELIWTVSFALASSFCVLAAGAWSALFWKKYCQSCGCRFRSNHKLERNDPEYRFPSRFCVLNGLALFFLCVVGRYVMELLSGAVYPMIVGQAVGSTLGVLVWTAIFVPCQGLVWVFLRMRIRRDLVWAMLFLLPAIWLGTDCLYKSVPTVAAREILAWGELATLPESATDIKIFAWSSLFSGEEFLRFRASPDDIERFLETSPILERVECQDYSKDRMRLPIPKDYGMKEEHFMGPHEYFSPEAHAPEWYREEFRGPGRRYIIHPKRYHYPGEVIIDDEKNLVFVYLCFS
jgi:hypothetical protein